MGKTTLAANVAGSLARSGCRVIALDLDPQNALRLHFGISLADQGGFTHRLMEQLDWHACLRSTPAGVSLLPYGPTTMHAATALGAAVTTTPGLLGGPIRDILSDPHVCLVVDTPPGPSPLLAALLPRVDLLITVLLVDATSVSLIPAIERGAVYDAVGGDNPVFVLNQFDPRVKNRRGNCPSGSAASREPATWPRLPG